MKRKYNRVNKSDRLDIYRFGLNEKENLQKIGELIKRRFEKKLNRVYR